MPTQDLLIAAITILARWQRSPESPRRDYEGIPWLVEHSEGSEPLSADEVESQKEILRAIDLAAFARMFPNEEVGPT